MAIAEKDLRHRTAPFRRRIIGVTKEPTLRQNGNKPGHVLRDHEVFVDGGFALSPRGSKIQAVKVKFDWLVYGESPDENHPAKGDDGITEARKMQLWTEISNLCLEIGVRPEERAIVDMSQQFDGIINKRMDQLRNLANGSK